MSPTTKRIRDAFRCSFCTKASDDVGRLVAGPGVFICDECVDLCVGIIDAHRGRQVTALQPPWATMSDDEVLQMLSGVAASVERVERQLDVWVEELRRRKVSWARIGEALGTTRQSAWERLAPRVEPKPAAKATAKTRATKAPARKATAKRSRG